MSTYDNQLLDDAPAQRDPYALLEELVALAGFGTRYSTLDAPAVIPLVANQPAHFQHRTTFASVAVINPNAFTLYLGLGGSQGGGQSGGEFMVVAPNGWVVLPLRADQLTIGAGANAGLCYVLPFKTAQPFAAGTNGVGGGLETVIGSSASGAADDGSNPVKVGTRFNATLPTFVDGQRADLQSDVKGNLRAVLYGGVSAGGGDLR